MARIRKRPLADQRADNRGGPWAGIPHVVLKSAAYQDLSLFARAILFELVLAFNGFNNGKIAMSQRQLSARLQNSNYRKIGRSIAELAEHGLIEVEVEGQWKPRLAREYRLTFASTGTGHRPVPATNEYLGWTRVNICADDVSSGKVVSAEKAAADQGVAAVAPSAD